MTKLTKFHSNNLNLKPAIIWNYFPYKVFKFKMQDRIRTPKVLAAVRRLDKCGLGVNVYDVTEAVVRQQDSVTASRARVREVLEDSVAKGLLRKSSSKFHLAVSSTEGVSDASSSRQALWNSTSKYHLVISLSQENCRKSSRRWSSGKRTKLVMFSSRRRRRRHAPRVEDLSYLEARPRNTKRLTRISETAWQRSDQLIIHTANTLMPLSQIEWFWNVIPHGICNYLNIDKLMFFFVFKTN